LHGSRPLEYLDNFPDASRQLLFSVVAITIAPWAVVFDSTLLAYAAVFAVYTVIGFSFACFGLCYVVGFTSRSALQRVVVTSFIVLSLTTFAHISVDAFAVGSAYHAFGTPLAVCGALTFFLGMLSRSSAFVFLLRPNVFCLVCFVGVANALLLSLSVYICARTTHISICLQLPAPQLWLIAGTRHTVNKTAAAAAISLFISPHKSQ
jgi:hypothetical protein